MLEGKKVLLRPLEVDDATALLPLINSSELVGRRYLPHEFSDVLPISGKDIDRVVDKWLSGKKQATLAIVTLGSEQLVGYGGLGWGWDPLCPWTSVVLDPKEWRRGYGGEALDLLLGHAFGATVAHSISCWLPEWNREGLAFAQERGFRPAGRVRRAGIREGKWFDSIPVDLLRREWLALRGDGDAPNG